MNKGKAPISFKQKIFFGSLGLLFLLALWEFGHQHYGSLVLPSLLETSKALLHLASNGAVGPALAMTFGHAGFGWLIGAMIGIAAGAAAGLLERLHLTLQPIAIVLLGVPAIAWIVLALLWFGGRWAVVFTVAVAITPLVFAAAAQGARSLDGDLAKMARSFQTPPLAMMVDVYGPHMLSYLFPALATTLALSWKISVMAELLSGAGGIGDGLAAARARMDTAEIMAWIVVVVVTLIVIDRLLIQSLRRFIDRWREDSGRVLS